MLVITLFWLQDDVGGASILQKKWTSFTKASLLCHTPKQLTVVQDVFPLPPAEGSDSSDTLFYGIFTPEWYTHTHTQ